MPSPPGSSAFPLCHSLPLEMQQTVAVAVAVAWTAGGGGGGGGARAAIALSTAVNARTPSLLYIDGCAHQGATDLITIVYL